MNIYARTGAVFYVLWGALHVVAAWKVYMLGESLDTGMVQARIFQDAWNLLIFAFFGMAVAVVLNWNNSRCGYWLNFIVISAADIGFIVTVLIPGYLPWIPAGLGPLLWLVALAFSTIGIMQKQNNQT